MAGNVIELTDADFDNTVNGSDAPVLVDFWAPWCGPCKMLADFVWNFQTLKGSGYCGVLFFEQKRGLKIAGFEFFWQKSMRKHQVFAKSDEN